MKITRKIATAAAAAIALSGVGIGTAVAAAHSPHSAYSVRGEPTGPDTDAVQQGDQTSPDPAGAAAAAKSASHVKAAAADDETNSESENGPSDGPGGHADASGDVQYEFSGVQ